MARSKPHRKPVGAAVAGRRGTSRDSTGAGNRGAAAAGERGKAAVPRPGGLNRFLALNGVFWAFCIVQLVFVRVLLPDFGGIYFFFGFLMVGFSIVSVFDYLSDRMGIGEESLESDLNPYEN